MRRENAWFMKRKVAWHEVIEKDCQSSQTCKENATDCKKWTKLIKDDAAKTGFERENVFLVLAHPGHPGKGLINGLLLLLFTRYIKELANATFSESS